MSLYKSEGLEDNTDGILGLSPNKSDQKRKLHYLWALKDQGIISRAVVSFNIATLDMDDQPWALFGGIDESQVEGGQGGMETFPSFPNFLGTWALEAKALLYANEIVEDTERSYPAIIDTGTSQMTMPPRVF